MSIASGTGVISKQPVFVLYLRSCLFELPIRANLTTMDAAHGVHKKKK